MKKNIIIPKEVNDAIDMYLENIKDFIYRL